MSELPKWPDTPDLCCMSADSRADYEIERADAAIARLRLAVEALNEAIEDIDNWATYASEYFQDKHDLAGTLAKHRASVAQIGPIPE